VHEAHEFAVGGGAFGQDVCKVQVLLMVQMLGPELLKICTCRRTLDLADQSLTGIPLGLPFSLRAYSCQLTPAPVGSSAWH
jgi:hypothetical protein